MNFFQTSKTDQLEVENLVIRLDLISFSASRIN